MQIFCLPINNGDDVIRSVVYDSWWFYGLLYITSINCFKLNPVSGLMVVTRGYSHLFWSVREPRKVNFCTHCITLLTTEISTPLPPAVDILLAFLCLGGDWASSFRLWSLYQNPQTFFCFWEQKCVIIILGVIVMFTNFHSNLCFLEVQFLDDHYSKRVDQESGQYSYALSYTDVNWGYWILYLNFFNNLW